MRSLWLSISMVLGAHLVVPSVSVSADLETIRERGYLKVAVKDNWRPLGFVDEDGNLAGFEITLARQLAVELFEDASAVEFYPVANRDRLSVVLNNEVDLTIAGLAITPMRERIVSFSTPYYLDGTGFVTRDPEIQSWADLTTAAIALIEGSDAVTPVHYVLPTATLIGVPSYQAALGAIEADQVNAFAGDITVLAGWVQEYPGYRLLPDLLTAEPLAVTLPKGNQYTSLRRFVNQAIQQWHEEGWLEEQATYWGLP